LQVHSAIKLSLITLFKVCFMLTTLELQNANRLIDLALEEDLGELGDVTSQAFIPPDLPAEAFFVARQRGVLAGLDVVALVCKRFENLNLEPIKIDGAALQKGDRLARWTGPARALLAAERTALNFLQRLSAIASRTAEYVAHVQNTPARILDTRKTTPGWRHLEKYAVRCGGGHNHRIGLYDAILIKDNHIAALRLPHPAAVVAAIERARAKAGVNIPMIVEVDDLTGFRAALPESPFVILLDNMTNADRAVAVAERNAIGSPVLLEASGAITLETLRGVAESGVDRISIGAITHSAPALDIGLDFVTAG
jgi:nicotinate-nucleotide pyrophosphorylase (carboxylating)